MVNYSKSLSRYRSWNRFAICTTICMLPAAILAAPLTEGTKLTPWIPLGVFGLSFIVVLVAYYHVRTFRCLRCNNYFAVTHPIFGTNTRGRKCIHCKLSAYAKYLQVKCLVVVTLPLMPHGDNPNQCAAHNLKQRNIA